MQGSLVNEGRGCKRASCLLPKGLISKGSLLAMMSWQQARDVRTPKYSRAQTTTHGLVVDVSERQDVAGASRERCDGGKEDGAVVVPYEIDTSDNDTWCPGGARTLNGD